MEKHLKKEQTYKHTCCLLFKSAQHESCELSFTWGIMRTAAGEIAPQIALRNCSKEVGEAGKISIHMIFDEGEYVQSSTYFSRRFLLVS